MNRFSSIPQTLAKQLGNLFKQHYEPSGEERVQEYFDRGYALENELDLAGAIDEYTEAIRACPEKAKQGKRIR